MNMGLQLTFYTLFLHEWIKGKVKVLCAYVLLSMRSTFITAHKMRAFYIIKGKLVFNSKSFGQSGYHIVIYPVAVRPLIFVTENYTLSV